MGSRRKCKKCQVIKDVTEFGRLPHGKNGLRSQCLECSSKYQREYRRNKQRMPVDEYVINDRTMRDHFYLHFGFTIDYRENWRTDYMKYYQTPRADQIRQYKKNK
jgi:hypothetical protein